MLILVVTCLVIFACVFWLLIVKFSNIRKGNRLIEIISRANSHIRYWKYRKSIGNPFPLKVAIKSWVRRFIFEAFSVGNGA